MSIICLGLLLQISSFMAVLLMQNGYLTLANRQSKLDLSCLSQATHIISNNNYVRKCHLNESELILYEEIQMDDILVTFTDQDTYIQVIQAQENKTIELDIYYDEKGISGFDAKRQ